MTLVKVFAGIRSLVPVTIKVFSPTAGYDCKTFYDTIAELNLQTTNLATNTNQRLVRQTILGANFQQSLLNFLGSRLYL